MHTFREFRREQRCHNEDSFDNFCNRWRRQRRSIAKLGRCCSTMQTMIIFSWSKLGKLCYGLYYLTDNPMLLITLHWFITGSLLPQMSATYTVVHSLFHDILLDDFGIFPWLVGRYCSYLLPKQAPATCTEKLNKIWRTSGRCTA